MKEAQTPRWLIEAAGWRTRLAELRVESTEEFRLWLLADVRNEEAWRKVQTAWDSLEAHAASPEFVSLRQNALAHARRAGLIRSQLQRLRGALPVGFAVAAAVLLMVAGVLWPLYHFDVYRTKTGERRVVTLTDGSEIALDSDSEVAVRYGKHSRELVLTAGQARFNVAHDVLRPFSVKADRHEVVATGTSFNVDLLGPELVVTLLEGHVVVLREQTAASAAEARVVLDAGEQLVLSPAAPPSVKRVNVDHAVAWESGSWVFDNEPLSKVVLRIGRYGGPPVVMADEATSKLKISGVFHEGDVGALLATVSSYLSLRAEQQPDGSILLQRITTASQSPTPN
jgi:transmembrane sensor